MLHPHLNRSGIQVRADGNRVELSGKVRSFFEKQMAQEAIRGIDGIELIKNDLEVDWIS